jgi:phospholipase/lecithinase/hemolysin
LSNSLTNHQTVIQTLYAKGARTLIMPNAVDISEIPQYNGLSSSQKTFIRQGVVAYNSSFVAILNQAMASLPGLKIYMPDMFALLDNMVANPANYGLINVTSDALAAGYTAAGCGGTGAYYLFWDPWTPTAKALEVMADTIQQMISPVQISNLTLLNGSNQLDVANIPIGLNGFVDGRTNLVSGSWTSVTNFNSTSATQTIFVPASDFNSTNATQTIFVPASDPCDGPPSPPVSPGGGTQTNSVPASDPPQFYRLRFPFAWSCP